jgi:hypothetical protein
MAATTLDLTIDCGGEFKELITWYDEDGARVDLAGGGYTAALQIHDAGDDSTLLTLASGGADPDSRIDLEVDETENADFGESSPSTAGVITIFINAVDTATLSGLSGVYDLILTPTAGAEHAIKLTKGAVILDRLITS